MLELGSLLPFQLQDTPKQWCSGWRLLSLPDLPSFASLSCFSVTIIPTITLFIIVSFPVLLLPTWGPYLE